MTGRQKTADSPILACEIGVDRVIAARGSHKRAALELYATRKLPAGAVIPGLGASNIADADAVREAIASALAAVSNKTRDVTAILPDAAVRVLLLDFDTLPEKTAETEAIIRFRLRKSLPFDVDAAALSYQAWKLSGGTKVMAVLSPRSIIEEYESAFRDAGYAPGRVIPSMIASLGLVKAHRPAMVIKVDPGTATVAIAHHNEILLHRTLDTSAHKEITPEELAETVHPSIVFFEDTYSTKLDQLLMAGMASNSGIGAWLRSETGMTVDELGNGMNLGERLGELLPGTMLTGVAGALIA